MKLGTFPESLIEGLKQAVQENCFPHALLIYGSSRSSKQGLALSAASALLCSRGSLFESCDCRHCRRIWGEGHPDVKLFPEGDEKSIKVDDIRELIGWARLRPFEADHKVLILDQVDRLSIEALNAFLKLLEEPPNQTTLILLAEKPSRLKSTLLSRCFQIPLRPLSSQKLNDALLNKGVSEAEAHFVSLSAEGYLESAEEIIEAGTFTAIDGRLKKLLGTYSYELVEDVLTGNLGKVTAEVKRKEVEGYLEAAQTFLRDVSLYSAGTADFKNKLFFKHRLNWIEAQAERETKDTLFSKQNRLEDVRTNLEHYGNPKISLMSISEILGEPILGASHFIELPPAVITSGTTENAK